LGRSGTSNSNGQAGDSAEQFLSHVDPPLDRMFGKQN